MTDYWTGEIEPATVEQVRQGRDGKMHVISADAGGVVDRIKQVDPRLNVRYVEAADYYAVYSKEGESEYLVGTYKELDQRVAADIEKVAWKNRQPGYSLADDLDDLEARAQKEFDAQQYEKIGESAEELAFALRKDLHKDKYRAFIKGSG